MIVNVLRTGACYDLKKRKPSGCAKEFAGL